MLPYFKNHAPKDQYINILIICRDIFKYMFDIYGSCFLYIFIQKAVCH